MLIKCGIVVAIISLIQGFPQDVIQFPGEEASFAGSQLVGNRIPDLCQAVNGENCIFPFIFKGETYNKCTYAGNSAMPWCALERSANQEVVTNRWGDCNLNVNSGCQVENNNIVNNENSNVKNNNKDCYTTGGPDAGSLCVFPFKHGSLEYHDCTRAGHAQKQLWCSTKVDSTGRHLAGQDFFGTCSNLCFSNNNRNVWNAWGDWGTCSAFCGGASTGVQERTRTCRGGSGSNVVIKSGSSGYCQGENKETKICTNINKCNNGDSCDVGATWKQDCNTCICTSEGKAVCTTLQCTGSVTGSPCTNTGNGDTDPQCGTPAPTEDPCTLDRGTGGSSPQCTGSVNDRNSNCVTSSGPSSQQACVFPFNYVGRTFTSCDVWRWGGKDQGKFWCSTKTDAKGNHINGQGNYGFCPDSQICRGDDLGVFTRIDLSGSEETVEEPAAQVAPE